MPGSMFLLASLHAKPSNGSTQVGRPAPGEPKDKADLFQKNNLKQAGCIASAILDSSPSHRYMSRPKNGCLSLWIAVFHSSSRWHLCATNAGGLPKLTLVFFHINDLAIKVACQLAKQVFAGILVVYIAEAVRPRHAKRSI